MSDRTNLLILTVIWSLASLIANPFGNFPLNDDWVYALAVKSLITNGIYSFPSPASANVGPQIYWGALFCLPFGFSFTALRFSTLVLGLIGIITLYKTVRLTNDNQKFALYAALALGLNPLYFASANTFMTDVPFIAVSLIGLFYYFRGFKNNCHRDYTYAIILTFVVILIRQFGVIYLVAFSGVYLIKYGFKLKRTFLLVILVVAGVGLHLGYQYWLLKSGRSPVQTSHSDLASVLAVVIKGWRIRQAFSTILLYTGFFAVPFGVALFIRQIIVRNKFKNSCSHSLILLFVVSATILWYWRSNNLPFVGNVMLDFGIGPRTLRDTFILKTNLPEIPESIFYFWTILTFGAILSAVSILVAVSLKLRCLFLLRNSNFPRVQFEISAFLLFLFACYFAILIFVSLKFPLFDRYFLLLLPLVFLLISNLFEKIEVLIPWFENTVSLSVILVYGCIAVIGTHDYLEWSRKRWEATTELLTIKKVQPNAIDAGYEFNGFYLYNPQYVETTARSWWWVEDDEYVVASGNIPNYEEVKAFAVQSWMPFIDQKIVILKRRGGMK